MSKFIKWSITMCVPINAFSTTANFIKGDYFMLPITILLLVASIGFTVLLWRTPTRKDG